MIFKRRRWGIGKQLPIRGSSVLIPDVYLRLSYVALHWCEYP